MNSLAFYMSEAKCFWPPHSVGGGTSTSCSCLYAAIILACITLNPTLSRLSTPLIHYAGKLQDLNFDTTLKFLDSFDTYANFQNI